MINRAAALLALVLASCSAPGTNIQPQPYFGEPTAIRGPRRDDGGRFEGAQLSSGFGILYRNGYTSEHADQEGCGGFFGEQPEHVLSFGYTMRFKVTVHTDDDLVMRMVGPDGEAICAQRWSFVNENLALTQTFEPGRYELWVGTTRRQTSSTYRLVLSE